MNFSDYCYGPLQDVLDALQGDFPPDDPAILRVILARCVQEVIEIRAQVQRSGGAQ